MTVVPCKTPAADVLAMKPDGVFFSNGPGDPSAAPYAVENAKAILGKMPVFGICMGHQVLGQAFGGTTYKLKFGCVSTHPTDPLLGESGGSCSSISACKKPGTLCPSEGVV